MIARILVKPFGSIWNLKDICKENKKGILVQYARFLYNWYQYEHGSAISYNSIFIDVPTLPHGTKQIIITGDVKIGTNCTIFQQVTIQNDTLSDSSRFGAPVIGNNCYIYPGVRIIGKVRIGDNVIIGPNVVITKDVPNNSIINVAEEVRIAK